MNSMLNQKTQTGWMGTKTRPINMLSTRNPVLYDILDKRDLINFFRTFHPNAEEYTFFSSAYGMFSRIDHILGYKSNLSKFKKI